MTDEATESAPRKVRVSWIPLKGERIVLAVCRPVNGFEMFPADPAAAEVEEVPVPNVVVADCLWTVLRQDFRGLGEKSRARVGKFIRFLAADADSRLRLHAAGWKELCAEDAEHLAGDPARDVREELSTNESALLAMSPGAVVRLCGDDAELMEHAHYRLDPRSWVEDFRERGERIEALCAAAAGHADPRVRETFAEYLREWRERFAEFAEGGEPDEEEDWSDHDLDEDQGPWAWVLAVTDAEGRPGAWLTGDRPVLPLGSESLSRIVDGDFLSGEGGASMARRLAEHPSHRVRRALAGIGGLEPDVVRRLARDTHVWTKARVLSNPVNLACLTAEEILAAVGDDPSLLAACARGRPCGRIVRRLAEHFAGDKDPYVAETLAKLAHSRDGEEEPAEGGEFVITGIHVG